MIKYLITIAMILTSCEASLHMRMIPNIPTDEVAVTDPLQIEEGVELVSNG